MFSEAVDALAVDETYVYVSIRGWLGRIPKNGGCPEEISREPYGPLAIVVDASSIYYPYSTRSIENLDAPSSIRRLSKVPGSSSVELVTDERIDSLAVDESHLYYVTPAGIMRLETRSLAQEMLVSGVGIRATALDDQFVYWTSGVIAYVEGGVDVAFDAGIHRVAKQGGEPELIADVFAGRLVANGDLFYTDRSNWLTRIPKSGGVSEDIAALPFVTDILAGERFVYAYAREYVAAFDVGAPSSADPAFQTPFGAFRAATDGEAIYFSQTGVFKVTAE